MQAFKRLAIEIEGGDAALTEDAAGELARMLRMAANRVEAVLRDALAVGGDADCYLHDINGVNCGQMDIETETVEPDGWLCEDCVVVIGTGDASSLDYHYDEKESAERLEAIEAGMVALGDVNIDSDVTEEFSHEECACCGTLLAGGRTGYYDAA